MSELALREVLESRGNNFQVLDEARQIIGYIVLLTALAGTHPKPWMWSIDLALRVHGGKQNENGTNDAG